MSSGVRVPDELVNTVRDMKLKKLDKPYTWMIISFKPSMASPDYLEVTDKGTESYQEFQNKLTNTADGCFAVVDVPLEKGGHKLTLISWAPDNLGPKPKMLVASTTAALKSKVDGCDQYQASDAADLELKSVQAKVERK